MKTYALAEPEGADQVTSLLSHKRPNVFLMAGGTDLMAEIKDEIVKPEVVVDLTRVRGLSGIVVDEVAVHVGGMTTVAELAENETISRMFPGLKAAALSLATPQLRNVGTVAGNLCQRPRCWYYRDPDLTCSKKGGSTCFAFRGRNQYHAILGTSICFIVHPSDLAPMLIALDASAVIASPSGDRTVPLEEFYILPQADVRKETVLEHDEWVKGVRIPLPEHGRKSTYLKIKERSTWDFAVVSVALSGSFQGKTCRDIRIVLGGVAPKPWRFEQAESVIIGKRITEDLLREAARAGLERAMVLSENAYKLDIVEAALQQAVMSLVD